MTTISGDDDSYDRIDKRLYKIWLNADGKVHRDGDLPAIIYNDCSVAYCKNGERHRDGDLPAVIYSGGTVFYLKNGQYHRDGDLPAMIYADGDVEYWVDGMRQK